MKKRDFSGLVRAKPIRFSERHLDLMVQALDHPAGNDLLGAEIIK